MKEHYKLLIILLFCAVILAVACNPVLTPPSITLDVQNIPSSTDPSDILVPDTPTYTPQPSPTAIPLPQKPVETHIPPTAVPFLPAGLVVIQPENISALQQVATLPELGASVVTYSPDSRLVAAGLFVSNFIKIWDLASGQELATFNGHTDPRIISYLAFSPDGLRLASGAQGWDAPNDSLILWDISTGRELQRFNGVLGAVSPDWSLMALTQRELDQESTLTLTNLPSGNEVHILNAPSDTYGITFSPDGNLIAAKMFDVFQDLFSFWHVDSGLLNRTLYNWLGFSYSPDNRYIAAIVDTGSGSEKGELNIFDAVTFKWIKTVAKDVDSFWYTFPAFSQDGRLLAASFGDHVTLWDTQTWEKLISLPTSGPSGFAFSPDGRIFTTYTQSGHVQLWGLVEQP